MSDLLVSVRNLLVKAQEFDKLDSGQQGAFRAHLTRLLNQVEDDTLKGALLKVREHVGYSTTRSYDKVTVEDVETEFRDKFAEYDTQRRGAFKAKVTRMLNTAGEAGEADDKQRLAAIQYRIFELENREVKDEIFDLLGDLLSEEDDDNDPDTVAENS